MEKFYTISWKNADGKVRHDYFCTREMAVSIWGDIAHELTFVNIWDDPVIGVRLFLIHLPLFDVTIRNEYIGW